MRSAIPATIAMAVALTASAFAAKPAKKTVKPLTPKQCSAACTAKMHKMGMAGSCPASMCVPGKCPMMTKAAHARKATPKPVRKPVRKG
jgi:NO-binding membrane sensor protein with MHYT domain